MVTFLTEGKLKAASDGSTWKGKNAYGLCLGVEPDPKKWTSSGEVEGLPVAPDRSELCGVLALVKYVTLILVWQKE